MWFIFTSTLTKCAPCLSLCLCQYKYQVNVDGTVAAYRFPYLMLGNSLVLKQKSPYYEHFYTHLKPGKHYIPLERNLADLIQKIKWAKVECVFACVCVVV